MLSEVNRPEQVLSDICLHTDREDALTAVLANVSTVLKAYRPLYAWVGFSIMEHDTHEMVPGPYQGPPTCTTRIPSAPGCAASPLVSAG
jgi:L-methionine (R)-S-oxide reductase